MVRLLVDGKFRDVHN